MAPQKSRRGLRTSILVREALSESLVLEPKAKKPGPTKLFVLDTNVPINDPTSLFRFEEHDIFLPMMMLEELDGNKQGGSEVARNARQTSRIIDEIVKSCGHAIKKGIELSGPSGGLATGKMFLQTEMMEGKLPDSLPRSRGDNNILSVMKYLSDEDRDRQVILVSKDINMRIKARAIGLEAQDYFNDKVLEDTDLLYTGMLQLPMNFLDTHGKGMKSWKVSNHTFYRVTGPLCEDMHINQSLYMDDHGGKPLQAIVTERHGRSTTFRITTDYSHQKSAVSGIVARNREQNFALNLLMDPNIDFVTLLGQAGTGKTLLTLAAGVVQTVDGGRYSEIIVTRATVPVGEDIGFLPGTEEEKMTPWMGAFDDNLEVLVDYAADANQKDIAGQHGKIKTDDKTFPRTVRKDLIRSRIRVKSLNFMRGRTFLNKFLIIDEAQNLTPKQMKTLITRAGPGTKVVCLGNIAQIDTPYLTEGSSGITYVVDRFKGWAHSGHITLQRGERSRLADHAAEVL